MYQRRCGPSLLLLLSLMLGIGWFCSASTSETDRVNPVDLEWKVTKPLLFSISTYAVRRCLLQHGRVLIDFDCYNFPQAIIYLSCMYVGLLRDARPNSAVLNPSVVVVLVFVIVAIPVSRVPPP